MFVVLYKVETSQTVNMVWSQTNLTKKQQQAMFPL